MDEQSKAKRNPAKKDSLGAGANLLGQILERSGRREIDKSRIEAGQKLQEMAKAK